MKGLPLAYNKDMQEDKEGVFDVVDTLNNILDIFPAMLESMQVKEENMVSAARKGYTNATELANYLVRCGLSFRQAHEVVGKAVLFALENEIELQEIVQKQWSSLFPEHKELYGQELKNALQVEKCVRETTSRGGPAPEETKRIVVREKEWLAGEKSSQK